METCSSLLCLCEVNPPVTGGFPSLRPVTRSFDVVFNLCLNNKWLSKQSKRRRFETSSRALWCHCSDSPMMPRNLLCLIVLPSHNDLNCSSSSCLMSTVFWKKVCLTLCVEAYDFVWDRYIDRWLCLNSRNELYGGVYVPMKALFEYFSTR